MSDDFSVTQCKVCGSMIAAMLFILWNVDGIYGHCIAPTLDFYQLFCSAMSMWLFPIDKNEYGKRRGSSMLRYCIDFKCGVICWLDFQQFPFGLKFFRAEKKDYQNRSKLILTKDTHIAIASLKERTHFFLFLSLSLDNKKKGRRHIVKCI